ncbi:T9SS type A sorting domain-containing protein [candidate division KSB1 bacterium]|nr:T9SS type A sorting domain-containing protein [candidate division KSB1 bacterium]
MKVKKWKIVQNALFLGIFAGSLLGQSANDVWVEQAASTGEDIGNCITVDNSGDIIITGRYANSFKFQNVELQSQGIKDIFIAKLDTNGVLKWLNYGSGPGEDRPYGLVTDAFGNSILVGALDTEMDFSGTKLVATGGSNNDFFIAKFGPHGNLLWAKNGGSRGFDQGYDVTLSSDGDYVATGWFWGTAYFDGDSLKSRGSSDVFIVKYSPAGEMRWVRSISGKAEERAYGIAADTEGRFYVTGFTDGAITSGDKSTEYDTSNASEIFLAAFKNTGEPLWVRTLGSHSSDRAFSVAVDLQGNPLVTGRFGTTIEQDGVSVTATGAWDVILAKYSPSGNLLWAKNYGGRDNDYAYDVTCDESGFIYLTGGFGHQAFFGNHEMHVNGQMDAFVTKLNNAGDVIWAASFGGAENDLGWSAVASPEGSVYCTGSFRGISFFGKNQLTAKGSSDIYIAKLCEPKLEGMIAPVVVESALVTQEFEVSVVLDSVTNLYEARFELLFSEKNQIELAGDIATSLVPGSFLGEDPYLSGTILDENKGINIVVRTRDAVNGATGFGEIVKVKCRSLSTTPFDTDVQYTLSNLFAKDVHGNPIYLRSANDSIRFVGLPVWPGDTNDDGLVDESDVLRLGQFWGKSGYARLSEDIEWGAKKAVPWENLKITYADADGNGIVGQADLLAIGHNWMKDRESAAGSSGKRQAISFQATPAFLHTVCVIAPDKPNEIMVELHVQGAEDLFGLALGLDYGNAKGLHLLSVQPGELFQGDILSFAKDDINNKTVWLGLTQKNGTPGSKRGGVAARFLFQVSENGDGTDYTDFEIVELKANNSEGAAIQFHLEKPTIGDRAKENTSGLPTEYALLQNTPNPFNPETTINYSLPQSGIVILTIYDTLGKHVKTLTSGHKDAGYHSVKWDGRNENGAPVASGFYFYQLSTPVFKKNLKMLLLR